MKSSYVRVLPVFLIVGFLLGTTRVQAGPVEMKVGKTYHGFKLVKQKEVKEIGTLGRIFEHIKSGARLMKLESEDDNKLFCITFKTLPDADHGIPHILEHSVLNGSRKYPVKSPFDILMKGSLNTFLNAMTASDFTLYPVASQNKKDFYNLMDVYLDAVLHPRIYDEPKIFYQEGWHYSLEKKDAELKYNGVVYNEMKGAFSSPTRVVDYITNKSLFPDTIYGFSHGGHPDAIPELTYQKYREFHKKYYHPSNSYITLYGDGDTLEELKFINDNYLSKFKKTKFKAVVPLQKPFDKMKEVIGEYPVASTESTKDKTYLTLNFVAGGGAQADLTMALELLTEVIADLPAAPLRKALIGAGIGKDIYATYDDTKQGVFSIVVKNANPEDKDKFKQIVFDTLRKVVKEGLNKKDIEGVINRTEFRLREADYGGWPKGLFYTFFSLRTWGFADNPFPGLEYEKKLQKVRSALTSSYLEGLIEKHLLNNPHANLVMVKPKPGLEDEHANKLKEKLAKVKAGMTEKQLDELVKQTKELKAYQDAPDKPEDIAKIPMLTLEDLETREKKFEVTEREVAGTKVLHFDHPTNGIIYLQLLFDASVVPQELIPHAKLLSYILVKMDTAKRSYGEIDTELNIHTGGLDIGLNSYLDIKDGKIYHPKLAVTAKVLTPKFEKLLKLTGEVILETRFEDKKRLKEVIGERNSRLQSTARQAGHYLASVRLASYLSQLGMYAEQIDGLTFIKSVADLAKNFDARVDDFTADLSMVSSLLFNRHSLIIGVTCSQEDYQVFEKHIPVLLGSLGDKKTSPQKYAFEAVSKNEGLLSASKVQYVAKGANFRDLGYQWSGKLTVLDQILSNDYLNDNIRVKAGAYGAWSDFDRSGFSSMTSYRDPHLKKTLETYDKTVDYLKDFKVNDREMTRYVIGTIARRDRPKTPAQKGRLAVANYLRNLSHADLQKTRDEILATRQADIQGLSKMIAEIMKKGVICVYGNEKKIMENKEIFEELVKVID